MFTLDLTWRMFGRCLNYLRQRRTQGTEDGSQLCNLHHSSVDFELNRTCPFDFFSELFNLLAAIGSDDTIIEDENSVILLQIGHVC